jgi:Uma2 family endonuclease
MALPALQHNPVSHISVEEYLRQEETAETKHEYVGGDVIALAGATEEHNRIVANLIREVGSFLKGKLCDIFPSDLRVTNWDQLFLPGCHCCLWRSANASRCF